MPATIAAWTSGLIITNIQPNATKATVTLSNEINAPAATGWLLTVWGQPVGATNWIPEIAVGDSGVLLTTNNTVTFPIQAGKNFIIQVFGITMPNNGIPAPEMFSAPFYQSNAIPQGVILTGYNFASPPPGISQLNPTTSITVGVVLSGGGGM